jgi:BirA family transcriptional regulator, biotin operon repressor / biotin---[acetyl-CoA-carboxylase] ligase
MLGPQIIHNSVLIFTDALEPMRVNPIIEVVAQTGSTNTDLLLRDQLTAVPVVRIAWQQTGGRGTRGKPWVSNAHDSLTFSLGWCQSMPSVSLASWSIVVGVVLCHWLSQQTDCRPLKVKWPNDLVFGEFVGANSSIDPELSGFQLLKVAGILVESRIQADHLRLVTGIGINLRAPPMASVAHALPIGAIYKAATPAQLTQDAKLVLAQNLAQVLVEAWAQFERVGLAPFLPLFAQFDALKDQSVSWLDLDSQVTRRGRCLGVDENGLLIVEAPGLPTQRLDSASAQVRLA